MRDEEKKQHYDVAARLLAEQNFVPAVVAGAIAMLLAAVAFAIVSSMSPNLYGFAAAGVGMVVGATIGFLGRGIETKFGVLAAVYTITGCLLGNLFRVIMEIAQPAAASPAAVLQDESLPALLAHSLSLLSPIDLVYLLIAVFAAVFLAKRPLSRSDRLALGLYAMRD
jgi:hypothetical protein